MSRVPSKPISVLAALAAGFDRVAAKPILILPPLVLDLFLWFGPHLALSFLVPLISEGISVLGTSINADPMFVEQIALIQQRFDMFIERYNLMSALSSLPAGMPFNIFIAVASLLAGMPFNILVAYASLPAGVPSLMTGYMPKLTPLGPPQILEMNNFSTVVVIWAGLTIIGLGLGAFYHRWLAQQAPPKAELASIWMTWGRIVLLFLFVYIGGFLLLSVIALLASIVELFVPQIGTILLFLVFSLLFWAAVYLTFSVHGIVLYRFRVVKAMLESVHVVRWNLLSTLSFLFLSFLITWFGTQVWVLPSEASWYKVLALIGHAFISATLLVSSYVFYQGRRTWLVEIRASLAARATGVQDPPGPSV